jgi:hypothetical protein
MEKYYKKSEIIDKIQNLVKYRIYEVSGLENPKSEKEAIVYLLRRFRQVFEDFGYAINTLMPEAANAIEDYSKYKIPQARDESGKIQSFYKQIKNIHSNLRIPYMKKTFIDKNDTQMQKSSPAIKRIISNVNILYSKIVKNFSGYPSGISLKMIILDMKKVIKSFFVARKSMIAEIEKSAIAIKIFQETKFNDQQLRKMMSTILNEYPPTQDAFQDLEVALYESVEMSIKNKTDFAKLRKTVKKDVDELILLIKKFIHTDSINFYFMQSKISEDFGEVNEQNEPGKFMYHYKIILEAFEQMRVLYSKLETQLKEKYQKESPREQESTERYTTVIELFESYASSLFELIKKQIEKCILTFDIDPKEDIENVDYGKKFASLLDETKRQKDELNNKLQKDKEQIKEDIKDFYVRSGSSYRELSDPNSLPSKKIKMVDDLSSKFEEEMKDILDFEQGGFLMKYMQYVYYNFLEVYKEKKNTPDASHDEAYQQVAFEFDEAKKEGAMVLLKKTQNSLNQFIKFYIKNYNRGYEPTDIEVAPDYIVNYDQNEYIESQKILADKLKNPALDIDQLLPKRLFGDFYNSFYQAGREV